MNTIVITMGSSALAGSSHHGSNAGMTFELVQDLDTVPLRANARPPRVGMIGRVVGALQVIEPDVFGHAPGDAQQGPATACLSSVGINVLSLDVEPLTVACGQKLAIDYQTGPVEAPIVATLSSAGCFRLAAQFGMCANQDKGVLNRRYAVADFGPAPQLDAFWADALTPFRAVPRSEFGYKPVLRVVDDTTSSSNNQN